MIHWVTLIHVYVAVVFFESHYLKFFLVLLVLGSLQSIYDFSSMEEWGSVKLN